ncbi:AAA family ATPase [Streptomyces sp. NPDC087894]|uniref:AAA family ATPase n=1 Tax=Streptomyces sp. NPDC087894 TaxID=3365816 RepID=UPI003828F6F4
MHLQTLHVNGFRSVADATLEECGELNVLIGKNNSGKSNILTAIKFFFDFFKGNGNVASTSPDVSRRGESLAYFSGMVSRSPCWAGGGVSSGLDRRIQGSD